MSSAVKRGSKVGGFVAWQPGLVPAVTTPSIDQFITHLTTVGYCAPQYVILMSRTVDPASLDRCSVCAWITYISMLSLLFNYRLIIRRLTGSIPTSVEYFSLFQFLIQHQFLKVSFAKKILILRRSPLKLHHSGFKRFIL